LNLKAAFYIVNIEGSKIQELLITIPLLLFILHHFNLDMSLITSYLAFTKE